MTQSEIILEKGYKALVETLGVVGMIRFIQHFSQDTGDYTKERHQWLDRKNVDDVLAEMEHFKTLENEL